MALLIVAACGADGRSTFDAPPLTEADAEAGGPTVVFPPGGEGGCFNLECKQAICSDGSETTLTGTVMAPNGTLPLYNVIVYVPNAEVAPMETDLKCDQCGKVSGQPLVSTLSGTDGTFTLKNVPAGEDIPLVIQVGKWRRQVTLPKVDPCVNNRITDVNLTRLPKKKSEGDIPKIAVTTGRCDQLACLLPKLGLDDSEFTSNSGNGRLHLYRGARYDNYDAPAPSNTPNATELWNDKDTLSRYDMVLLSCECGEFDDSTRTGYNKSASAKEAMYDYAAAGGRIFASHFHYTWAEEGPLSTTADWRGSSSNREQGLPTPFLVDRSFAKGEALAKWLVTVDATDTLGEIPIRQPRENVFSVNAPNQRWVYSPDTGLKDPDTGLPDEDRKQATKYLSVNTPVGKPIDQQCGKFVFADMHLWAGDEQPKSSAALPNEGFPGTCDKELNPEEKALAFLFFDLASCIQDDRKPPVAPR